MNLYLSFLVDYIHLSKEQMEERLERAQEIFLEMCDKQDKRIEEETPTTLFISLLREMLLSSAAMRSIMLPQPLIILRITIPGQRM